MLGLSGLITPSLDEMVFVAKEMQVCRCVFAGRPLAGRGQCSIAGGGNSVCPVFIVYKPK